MVQKIVTFDVALKSTERQWVQKIPEVYTNDLGSVSLQFRITDCTDTELTGSTAMVLLKMRDGSFFQGPSVDVERTLNVFSYTLKENEGNHDGLAEIQLIVTIGAKEFATQKYNFKVITGLDSEVAREIMIYDWSTLTAEARAYIDQFTADELLRDAEFDNNQFDRNVAFNADQGQRDTDFGLAQTQRVNDFNAAEAARVQAFNNAEAARAAASLNKLMALDARTEFEARNEVVNGDFSNGITGWTTGGTSVTANNILSNTVTTNQYNNAFVLQILNLKKNNKYYILGSFRVRDSGAVSALLLLYNGSQYEESATINLPVKDVWYTSSNLFTPTTDDAKTTQMRFRHEYPSGDLANGKVLEVKYVAVIDLTAAFGAGKEPTLAEMDRLMARFPNSWFDGVKAIQTIETLYQEKANKTQEAWITPSLLNGFTSISVDRTVQYMKDQLGFVHFRGDLEPTYKSSDVAFTLPDGYPPSRTMFWDKKSGHLAVTNEGGVESVGVDGWHTLNSISFRAEAQI